MLNTKIIVDNKKLAIFEIDKSKNIERKIYESEDFCQVIKQLTKIDLEDDIFRENYFEEEELEEEVKKVDFQFRLVKILKNGMFIIVSENIITYGAYFFIKFNNIKKDIEIIEEEGYSKFEFIKEFSNGNFLYINSFPITLYNANYKVFDIEKNESHRLHSYDEYDRLSEFVYFINGFAFINNAGSYNCQFSSRYLNVLEGLDFKIYEIDFFGFHIYIRKIIYDDKYLYLFIKDDDDEDKKVGDGVDRVYILNIKKKKFYPNFIKFSNEKNISVTELDNKKIKKYSIKKNIKSIFDKIIKSKEINAINIIYHDENLKFDGKQIILDSQYIQKDTKGSLILTNKLENLDILLKKLIKDQITSKFFLIVNGSSAEKTFDFINNKNYKSLFINGIIYTSNLKKYKDIKEKHPDFFKIICVERKKIVKFIEKIVKKIKLNNANYYINPIINNFRYKEIYYPLHKELSKYYGDETEKSFDANYKIFSQFLENEAKIPNEIKESLLKSCQLYKELNNKNYEEIIIGYIKDENFSETLNILLMKKDISIYNKIGYFASNLTHSFVQYGKNTKRAVNYSMTFYCGILLDIVELLELLKNRGLTITFPNFVSLLNNRDSAANVSERKLPDKERKDKELYSVIMTINYLFNDGYEPCIFNIKNISQNPDEEEFILLPFTFLNLKSIEIDSIKFIADLELDIIGKKEILEYKIKESKNIEFDNLKNIMFSK